ncbi:MAG: beta-glucosidase [Opitutus sp.]|nr:beta-glucosidase [Opitutus sp.]MCS6246573.1 beta-glucosidase [Opitutus sp.]MCS6272742.1 beta-glucosidase [Opitutus sp.]MCS6276374.1 beta-glucosidase [Opitutus sp.]MCS6301978.1 beta-glucosidase [Opitutus sp.]
MHPAESRRLDFPKNFVWGVATAAPQIEGAAFADGKGESVWDHFSRQPGRVHKGDTLDIACDHYHRFDDDFALMAKLGVKHYRLSIAWPRIIPDGEGAVNQAGIDFYHRLFDSLEKHGITPWVTMFHWDTPQALEVHGGWRNRRTPEAFGRYADTIVKAFGKRVKNWITINEIRCFTHLSYAGNLNKAPGLRESPQVVNQTVHHALLAHGHGVRAVREFGGRGARVGITDNLEVFIPVEETEPHLAATRAAFTYENDRILGAIYHGRYTPAFLRACGKDRPEVKRGDFDLIGQPTDFLGLNIYTGTFVRATKGKGFERLAFPPGYPQTTLAGWLKTVPQSIYWGTKMAADVYGAKNIYITENGYGTIEEPNSSGEIHDLHRRDYLRQYLVELRRAITDRVPVKGYFCWSFMDNYEWEDGYSIRFGLVHTDYQTQKRTPKLSAHWYSTVMRENRIV